MEAIYVVDANDTPDSIEYLTKEEREKALNRTARAFMEAFLLDAHPKQTHATIALSEHDEAETALAAGARDRVR